MKKWFGTFTAFLILLLCGITGMTAKAAETKDTVVVLGADLSAEQRAGVLQLMGLTEAELADCTVLSITNETEHAYLEDRKSVV